MLAGRANAARRAVFSAERYTEAVPLSPSMAAAGPVAGATPGMVAVTGLVRTCDVSEAARTAAAAITTSITRDRPSKPCPSIEACLRAGIRCRR